MKAARIGPRNTIFLDTYVRYKRSSYVINARGGASFSECELIDYDVSISVFRLTVWVSVWVHVPAAQEHAPLINMNSVITARVGYRGPSRRTQPDGE